MKRILIGLLMSLGSLVPPHQAMAQPDSGLTDVQTLQGADDPLISEEDLALLQTAVRQHSEGAYEQSLGTYRQVYGQLKTSLRQDDHPLLLQILSLVTDVFLDMGQYQQAEGTLVKQIEMQTLKLAKPGWQESEQSVERAGLGAAKIKLGLILTRIGRLEEAPEPLSEGTALLEEALGRQHRLVVESQFLTARTIWNLGRFHEAAALMEGVLGRIPGTEGIDPAVAGEAAEETGEMLLSLGRIADAVALWDQTAVELESRLPATDPGLIVAYRRLGEAHAANGDLDAAEEYWRKSLQISRLRFGETSGEAAADYLALSVVLELLQKTVGAVNYRDLSVAGFDHAKKQNSITENQLRFCRRAGGLLLTAGLNERAIGVLQRVAQLAESQPEVSAEEKIAITTSLARCQLAKGEVKAADGLLRTALATAVRSLGKRHFGTLAVVELMAITALRQDQYELAANLMDVLFKASPARQTTDREFLLAETIAETAGLLELNEQAERASQLRNGWLALRENQYGPDGVELAEMLVAFADSYQASGRAAEAIPLYERAVLLREGPLGANHPAVAAVLLPLARAFRAQRQDSDAETAARRGLAIWEATLPDDHPVVVETIKMLTGALYAQEKFAEVAPYYERLLKVFEQQHGPRSPQVERLLTRMAEVAEAINDTATASRYRQRTEALQGN